jgi:hypothetical protein
MKKNQLSKERINTSETKSQRTKSSKGFKREQAEENQNPNAPHQLQTSKTRNHGISGDKPLTELDLVSITTRTKTVDLIDTNRSRGDARDSATNESRIRKDTVVVGTKSSAISIDDPSISY